VNQTYQIDILEIRNLPRDLFFESREKSKDFLFIGKALFDAFFSQGKSKLPPTQALVFLHIKIII
jgi:hypothetical protein